MQTVETFQPREALEGQMKSVQEVMAEKRSANQVAFAAWLEAEAAAAGLELKSEAAAADAFRLGAVLGHACYKLYQTTKPTSVIAQRAMEEVPAVVAVEVPAVAKPAPRTRKAAAKA